MDNPGYFSDGPKPTRSANPRSPSADNRPPTTNPRPPRRPSMPAPGPQNAANVSFQEPERAWRSPPPQPPSDTRRNPRQAVSQRGDDRPRGPTADAWGDYSPSGFVRAEEPDRPGRPTKPGTKPGMDPEAGPNTSSNPEFVRKRSLTRPDREKIEPGHRQWHYRNHAAGIDEEDQGARVDVIPSTTGNYPQANLHRGKSLLARDEDVHESGLALFKRGATLRRKRVLATGPTPSNSAGPGTDITVPKRGLFKNIAPGPINAWMIYCWFLTVCVPPFLLQSCGMKTPERQRAWREKMGLMSIILIFMAAVGFLTFGFTQTVCGKPPTRFQSGTIDTASVIIHGYDYDLSRFQHPYVSGVFTGKSNPLYEGGYGAAGMDLSFMFQYDAYACRDIITAANGSAITQTSGQLDWIFPCNMYNQYGTSPRNMTGYDNSTDCHIKTGTQALFKSLVHPSGQVYYTWDQIKNSSRNLAVYETAVLDLNLLNWLDTSLVQYPPLLNALKAPNGTFNNRDITMYMYRNKYQRIGQCLQQTIVVGYVDSKSIGCVASQVVLYVSLIFIIGVVGIRFGMAVIFGWFVSYRIGAFTRESYSQRMARAAVIENWTDNIYQPAPSQFRPSVTQPGAGASKGSSKSTQFLPTTSRFSKADATRPSTTYGLPEAPYRRQAPSNYGGSKGLLAPSENNFRGSRSTMSLPSYVDRNGSNCPFPLHNVVQQPPPDYEPFKFPLLHAICLVTAYSESLEGLRTTLDSLATTDYPNSHKVLMVIADGMVKGAGNDMTTPDIVLSMMKELVVPVDEVEAHSYVSIADGHKRHNMAKVYAGFYDYDDNTVEPGKQQRVPIVLVAKCGNPLEAKDAKPGNRGKRDSQMVLMAFLQKVMFDERMTTFEYEYFNSIWRCTGVSPDRYEVVLCVDADTKVFPDSLTRMTACMVHDEDIMGVCGETKIANKSESWVTMIQVFEYYISHHLTKAFESMFGGVTCLPGCFSMYRIKSPKGSSGYWVPILANPDIVEHYSENIVDTLHKKNLLLLGEDRYLTTLMLKTFPKRKLIFCPQAVCKTIVPDTFSVLLSQRRRWINSTVHNLAELLLVRDLCGTFCFSMQFVVGMELVGTLVLPAAIAFTLYLIIVSIIPGHTNTTLSLILLAIILGLPGLLIVITSRKIAYVGWMLVYLISLPIWNFVLPAYSFWHFDDFSWGQTRRVSGDGDGHLGDKEGEFDSSHIVMKRWAEFERERRWKQGIPPMRDPTYDVVRRKDTRAAEPAAVGTGRRYSMGSASASDSYTETVSASRHSQQAMLPAAAGPYDSQRGLETPRLPEYLLRPPSPSDSSNRVSRSAEGDSSPTSEYAAIDDREPIIPRSSRQARISPPESSAHVRQVIPNSNPAYTSEMQNAYRYAQPQAVSYDQQPYAQERDRSSVSARPPPPPTGLPRPTHARGASRGVTLTDPGVVPSGSESVRRVARQGKRSSTIIPSVVQPPPQPGPGFRPPSRASTGAGTLPPGAAPAQYPKGGQ